jgi:hypothetical protein
MSLIIPCANLFFIPSLMRLSVYFHWLYIQIETRRWFIERLLGLSEAKACWSKLGLNATLVPVPMLPVRGLWVFGSLYLTTDLFLDIASRACIIDILHEEEI